MPATTIQEGNLLLVEFPTFYMEALETKNSSVYNPISAIVTRSDDQTNTNFASGCTVIAGNVIRITLLQDIANNF
jgi:hypothetical protein